MSRKTLILLLKIGVSLSLLGYIIGRLNYDKFIILIHHGVLPTWLLLSTFILIARNWIGAWRCRVLLQAKGIKIRISYVVATYFIGQFFNIFLPTSLGGDMARGYFLGKGRGQWADVAATVLMERVLGLISLIVLVFISLPFCFFVIGNAKIFYLALTLCLFMGVFTLLLLSPRLSNVTLLAKIKLFERQRSRVRSTLESLYRFKSHKGLISAFILSLVFQLVGIYTNYCLARGLGQSIQFFNFLLIMPLVQIISMFPFTLSGIGVREGAFVYLLTLIGVDIQVSLGIGLLFFSQLLILAFIGGIIYLFQHEGMNGLRKMEKNVHLG